MKRYKDFFVCSLIAWMLFIVDLSAQAAVSQSHNDSYLVLEQSEEYVSLVSQWLRSEGFDISQEKLYILDFDLLAPEERNELLSSFTKDAKQGLYDGFFDDNNPYFKFSVMDYEDDLLIVCAGAAIAIALAVAAACYVGWRKR